MDPLESFDWLTRKETSRLLSKLGCYLSVARLAQRGCNNNAGNGPPFYKANNRVRYRSDEVKAWAGKQMRRIG